MTMTITPTKIKCIQRSTYSGIVYNLELQSSCKEDDLFWVCNGVVVHNCFPKDLNALKFVANKLGIDTKVLDGVWEKNLEIRPPEDRDWEHMHNRAVSKRDE